MIRGSHMNEGVIKFNIADWVKTGPLSEDLWAPIEEKRKILFEKKLIGFDHSTDLGYGNISRRLNSGSDEFIITGTQTGELSVLGRKHYCIIVGIDLTVNAVHCKGPVKPSSESLTHGVCYKFNKSINAVVHIHSPEIWNRFYNDNKVLSTPQEVEYGSVELWKCMEDLVVKMDIDQPQMVLMKGHKDGIFFVGRSLDDVTNKVLEVYLKF
jgi:L-ribulose-5-phosphate 4-epimerase